MGMTRNISDKLIYEMVGGKPIYYQGYRHYLNGEKKLEEIMGSSYLQALIATQIVILLGRLLDFSVFQLLSNEVGLQFGKNHGALLILPFMKKAY